MNGARLGALVVNRNRILCVTYRDVLAIRHVIHSDIELSRSVSHGDDDNALRRNEHERRTPDESTTTVLKGFLAAAVLAFGLQAQAADITGAGATFPYPIYAKWADAYKSKTGVGMNYQSIGSGGGITQIKAKTVDFGASDMPLKPEELADGGPDAVPGHHRRRSCRS